VSLRLRVAGAPLMAVLLVAGTLHLGARMDDRTLTLPECVADEPACIGQRLELHQQVVAELGPDGPVLNPRGPRVTVLDWPSDAPAFDPDIARVSVIGTWLGGGRLQAESTMVHRFTGLKPWIAVAVLLAWLVGVVRFVLGRIRRA
jgi:hypothetical protein